MDLNKSRAKIDEIDRKIVDLFKERMQESIIVADYKKMVGKKVYDPIREAEKIKTVNAMVEDDFSRNAITSFFGQIMSISRKMQYKQLGADGYETGFQLVDKLPVHNDTKVTFFGEEGTYSQQAMEEVFGEEIKSNHYPTFEEVMDSVSRKEADYGILPLENSSTGGISDIYDLFMKYDNQIVGEHVLKIDHALLGLPGTSLKDVKTVYSHTQPFKQCAGFLKLHPKMRQVEYYSTADAAKKVFEDGDPSQAAIAGIKAAKYYHLVPLAESINEEVENRTRFIVISNQKTFTKQANKVSLCFGLPHESGSLYHMLSHFVFNGLNLTKIESRPIPGKSWEYRFFIDVEGNLNDPGMLNACIGMEEEAVDFRILGNYCS